MTPILINDAAIMRGDWSINMTPHWSAQRPLAEARRRAKFAEADFVMLRADPESAC
jgi:hypothetical protein